MGLEINKNDFYNLELILNYPKLKERIGNHPNEKEKVVLYLNEMSTDYSKNMVKWVGDVLHSTLVKLYDGINFDVPESMNLPQLVKEKNIIFVSNHQSHADYLLFNYLLFRRYTFSALIAGGINLNVFPIGRIFRRAGCFFIRRSFHNDITYKLTLEAYISYLLQEKELPIEFFYEGGRSRTGKLLTPKFGLFQMILDTHKTLVRPKELVFIPISITHEHLPEQKSLAREALGGKKKKEGIGQLMKLYRVMSKQFGTVHIKFNDPITVSSKETDGKVLAQNVAFDCFRSVGKGMIVTPSSVLSLLLLDGPHGALDLDTLYLRTEPVLAFCHRQKIPLSPSLQNENWKQAIERAISLFCDEGKIEVHFKQGLNKKFYSVKKECRIEMLYFKNAILHHFLVPYFIACSWIAIRAGEVKNALELKKYLIERRRQLKFEFYLPSVKELFLEGLQIISGSVGRHISGLDEVFTFGKTEMKLIGQNVGIFASSYLYIYEAYYIGLLTLQKLSFQKFSVSEYLKISKDVFELELLNGRVVRYAESYHPNTLQSALKYFLSLGLVEKTDGNYSVLRAKDINELMAKFLNDLKEFLIFYLRFSTPQGEGHEEN